jgi:uncharacterized protein
MTHTPKDFPFYNGAPIALTPAQWGLLMLAVAVGFAALLMPIGDSPWLGVIPAILFPAIPLLALRAIAGPHWKALFLRLRWQDVRLAVGVAMLNIAVTVSVGLVVTKLFGANANPAFRVMEGESAGELLLFALKTIPQLLGEEVLTMLPLLALLAFLSGRMRLSRRRAVVAAWLLTALLFGLLHLPTYGWNWAQCILIIGSARLVLSLAYLWTCNLWVSTLAHIINDWTLFGTGLLAMLLQKASA